MCMCLLLRDNNIEHNNNNNNMEHNNNNNIEHKNNNNIEQRTTRPQFVLFGSSIVQYSFHQGWGANLSHVYARKADIVLRGYAGWNSKRALQVVDKVFPKNAPKQPDLVIVYFGGNDSTLKHDSGYGPHVPLDEYKENMRKIAQHLKSLSEDIRIIFLSTPPIDEAKIQKFSGDEKPTKTNEECEKYSEACIAMCLEENIKVIDLWNLIQKNTNWKNAYIWDDGIHLTTKGNEVVSNAILDVLKDAEWKPSLYWKNMSAEFEEDSPYDPVTLHFKPINISHAPFPFPRSNM
ncbi:GDSL esterase/lipase WDL1-like [Cicer arietinum]|uniref:GDSL esterase/lipase CPRD49-like n=1 Tax=Cicer arietinum TaxID=3827 RepID=A0A1S2XPE3_CICAR|nr:GDSL esterase/lipase CPRD49-like [Cicer arietinum]